jgi:hypothetical protein
MIPIFVVIFLHLMTLLVIAVAISVPIADLSAGAAIIAVMIVSPAVVSVMVVPDGAITEARVVPEARIVSETRLILASPFPIFLLALTVEPVVLDIVVPALSKPFPVVRIILTVVSPIAGIGAALIPVLRASGGHERPHGQS